MCYNKYNVLQNTLYFARKRTYVESVLEKIK